MTRGGVQETYVPIMFAAIQMCRAWQLRSWDRFYLSGSFSHISLIFHAISPGNYAEHSVRYRPVRKYMPQPGLMKMPRTFIDETCFSSDVASIAFAYLLNSAHSSLKYAIQFLLIQTPQNPLQALKKLVLVSQVNPFEFFFDCRKQIQVTTSQIM
jgi:hypothetical protein